ncbi:AAA family ATPase [Fusobacterium hwasookii]
MIKKIHIKKYRKLENIDFEFSKDINIISGTNGTCKTSLLYIISNSFKEIQKSNENIKDINIPTIISQINKLTNPKIESLTRGDDEYNDPAPNIKGTLFNVEYYDGYKLDYRRHNHKIATRFAIKPPYKKGDSQKLPSIPIIYLGLFRLYSFGEFNNDDGIKKLKKKLPDEYIKILIELYKEFTNMQVNYECQTSMNEIKSRAEFKTNIQGIDSNTISAGEDNLYIILTALVSLRYYYENLKETKKEIESILLVDELDATLHPEFQIKLLELFRIYSKEYKIQITFTTHSITLLEYAIKKKINIFYLLDNIENVVLEKNINRYKLEMFLKNITKKELENGRKISIFTEDSEARFFLEKLMKYFSKYEEFNKVKDIFYIPEINISCTELVKLFSDKVIESMESSICILDGDCSVNESLKNKIKRENHLMCFPGDLPLEELLFKYSEELFEDRSTKFWGNQILKDEGITKRNYQTTIQREIRNRDIENEAKKIRNQNKEIFKKYYKFFDLLLDEWINDIKNEEFIYKFYKELNLIFKKLASFYKINANDWNVE